MIGQPRHGVQPSKRQIQSILSDGDSIDRLAKDSVAVYILLTVAMDYAEDIKIITARHGMFLGFLKHEYTVLDKAMRNFDSAFREMIPKEYVDGFLEGYDKSGSDITDYIETHKDAFTGLVVAIEDLAESYVSKNVENDHKDLDNTLSRLK